MKVVLSENVSLILKFYDNNVCVLCHLLFNVTFILISYRYLVLCKIQIWLKIYYGCHNCCWACSILTFQSGSSSKSITLPRYGWLLFHFALEMKSITIHTFMARSTESNHPHFPRILILRSKFHSNRFFPRTADLWTRLSSGWLAEHDNFNLFKSSVNHLSPLPA